MAGSVDRPRLLRRTGRAWRAAQHLPCRLFMHFPRQAARLPGRPFLCAAQAHRPWPRASQANGLPLSAVMWIVSLPHAQVRKALGTTASSAPPPYRRYRISSGATQHTARAAALRPPCARRATFVLIRPLPCLAHLDDGVPWAPTPPYHAQPICLELRLRSNAAAAAQARAMSRRDASTSFGSWRCPAFCSARAKL